MSYPYCQHNLVGDENECNARLEEEDSYLYVNNVTPICKRSISVVVVAYLHSTVYTFDKTPSALLYQLTVNN